MVKQRLLSELRRDFHFFFLKKNYTHYLLGLMLHDSKESLLTGVKVKVLGVELTDLCCRYMITYVSNTLSNATVACD